MKQYQDLSHNIRDGLISYKGLPAPLVCDFLSREESRKTYANGEAFHIAKIEMVANTGTYIDCPFHRYEEGEGFGSIEISRMADLPGIMISVSHKERLAIDASDFEGLDLKGKAVLVHTDWDQYWEQDQYFENHPHLTAAAAEYLREQDIALLGIDALNVDDTSTNARPVHSTLLGAGILIVEHLCELNKIKGKEFLFSALPPKFEGVGSFPVRAYAEIIS